MLKSKFFKKLYIILVLVISGTIDLCAQNLKKDAENMNVFYEKHKKISSKIEYTMYENYTTNEIYQKELGYMEKSGKNTYMKLGEVETINTDDYTLVVDNENKSVSLLPKKTGFMPSNGSITASIDSIKKFCSSYAFNKESNKLNSYTFIMQKYYPSYSKIKVFFNSSTFFSEKVILYCSEEDISKEGSHAKMAKARLEVNYIETNLNPKFTESNCSYERYLIKSGKKYTLKPEYKNYSLNVYTL
jgi:hypothetical protein